MRVELFILIRLPLLAVKHLQCMGDQIIGNSIIRLESVDSTNRFAMKELEEHLLPEGCLIVTSDQYAGRGMGQNQWESEPGKNLTFSVVLYPDFLKLDKQFMLNKMVSLALYDFVSKLLGKKQVRIKWPNDLYIGDSKVAGILINNILRGTTFISSVVGIGINMNQELFISDAPNPVSLKNITGRDYDLDRCLTDLCQKLDQRYNTLKKGQFVELDEDYHAHLYRLGRFYPYLIRNHKIDACIEGVDEYGHLLLKTINGTEWLAHQTEIVFLTEHD
jgi:BirA family biotin operon repressor/biotin-[acetyl-CoA-carboxylase] ligase